MAAGNPCYSGDSGIPLLPSSTNPAGNQYVRSRQGDTPPPAPVNPGANIRLTVGNCYEADVPMTVNTPDASDSPRVSIPDHLPSMTAHLCLLLLLLMPSVQ